MPCAVVYFHRLNGVTEKPTYCRLALFCRTVNRLIERKSNYVEFFKGKERTK